MSPSQATLSLLLVVVLACGLPALASAQESITGRLSLYLDEERGPLTAIVAQSSPGGTFKITNWEELQRKGLPSDVRSGAEVTITGRRLPKGNSYAVPFLGTEVALTRPAPPAKLLAVPWRDGGLRPQAVAKANLKVIIVRPVLDANCTAPGNSRIGSGNFSEWAPIIAKVNALQSACTGGRLSYLPPVMSPLVKIPCTRMPEGNRCDEGVYWQWVADARRVLKSRHKIDVDDYDHYMVDLPRMQDCYGMAGRGETGGKMLVAMMLMGPGSVAHEFGHNYRLAHSSKIAVGPLDPLPPGMPIDNTYDDSNIMGYSAGAQSCFSFPMSASIGLATPRRFVPKDLPAGKWVKATLKPTWAPRPQGATFSTGIASQANWTIWASYVVSTGSPYRSLLPVPNFNKAVLIHLTSPNWMNYDAPAVYRIRTMQSGDVFRWALTGLVFKYTDISRDGQAATIHVCREFQRIRCKVEPLAAPAKKLATKPLAGAVRLALPTMGQYSDWCLRACTSSKCQLPAVAGFPQGVSNVFFSRPCPLDASSAWISVAHASGYARWVNVATNQCLSLRQATSYTYFGTLFYQLKYRMLLEECNNGAPPDQRSNPQLFLRQQFESTELVTLASAMLYPGCAGCGVDHALCLEACPDVGTDGRPQPHCTANLPRSKRTTQHTMAVAGYCWRESHQRLRTIATKVSFGRK